MGNNAECNVVSIGNVRIRIHNSIMRTLTQVRHVLELKKNLIFFSTLDLDGCQYTLECGILKVARATLMIINGIKHNSLFELQGKTMMDFVTETSDASVRESKCGICAWGTLVRET